MRDSSVSMSVDPDTCGIHGMEKAKELIENRCLPRVIYDAVLDHELVHARQCQEQHDAFQDRSNLNNLGNFEVEAHIKGIQTMMRWLEKNCKDSSNWYDISSAQQRLGRLKSSH